MIIRPFRDRDEEGMRALFSACFGKEMSHEEWTWKYRNSCFGSSSVVAEDNGRIIAHYGGLKMRFLRKSEAIDAYQGCDAMTHPEYQKRGVIIKTALGFYEANPEAGFMFGFPSERHAIVAARWLGWEKHVYVNVMIKQVSRFAVFGSLWRIETGWDRITAGEIDGLWEQTKDSEHLCIEKKSGYVFWRYRDKPGNKYELLVFRGLIGRDLKAYAIIHEDGDELKVLDVIAMQGVKLEKLLGFLERKAASKGLKRIRIWINPRMQECGRLGNAGYAQETGIPLTLRIFKGSSFDPAWFFEEYDYSLGDYDAA